MKTLNTADYLDAGGDLADHDKALLRAEHLCFHKLGRMLTLGMPLSASLTFLAREARHAALKHALLEIQGGIEKGGSLTECMDKPIFSPATIVMIKVGEETGQLIQAVLAVADCMEKQLAA